MSTSTQLFLFVGRPASGKETQGKLLAEKLGAPLFMTGARFREIIASGSYLGKRIEKEYGTGLLMPAWVAVYLFQDFLFELPDDQHAVFEGTGRAKEEAETFEKVTQWLGRPYTVFNLEVSEETVMERSLGRARDGADKAESVKTRLAEYQKNTVPAIDYFRSLGKVVDVDGQLPVEEIERIVAEHVL